MKKRTGMILGAIHSAPAPYGDRLPCAKIQRTNISQTHIGGLSTWNG